MAYPVAEQDMQKRVQSSRRARLPAEGDPQGARGRGGLAHLSDAGCQGGDGELGGLQATGDGRSSTGLGGWDGSLGCPLEEAISKSKSESGSRASEGEGSGAVGRSGGGTLAGSAGAGRRDTSLGP